MKKQYIAPAIEMEKLEVSAILETSIATGIGIPGANADAKVSYWEDNEEE